MRVRLLQIKHKMKMFSMLLAQQRAHVVKCGTSRTCLMNEAVWVVGVSGDGDTCPPTWIHSHILYFSEINFNLNDSIKSGNYTVNLALVIEAPILAV